MQKQKTKVIIVGGGFGGVYTAKNLIKYFNKDEIEITLINKTNYFLFTPLLHEVATGGLTPDSIVEPIREVFRNCPINFIEDTVIEIRHEEKTILTTKNSYEYDFLVISSGAETNYFEISGARENSFTLKNLSDAIALRNHILDNCEKAVNSKNKELLSFAIIGAGPTGVELASELVEYVEHTICSYYKDSGFRKEDIQVTLITSTPDIISQFPEKMRAIAMKEMKKRRINVITNAIADKIEPGLIYFKDGKSIKTNTIVWVAGVTPTLYEIKGIEAGAKGRIEVNDYLQNIKTPTIFALGDASGAFPMLAQVAVQQAKTVAQNIYKIYRTGNNVSLDKFIYKQKGLLISLGQWYAIGNFFGTTFSGKIMWGIRRTVYLFNFLSWRKRFEIAIEWTINMFYPRDITMLK